MLKEVTFVLGVGLKIKAFFDRVYNIVLWDFTL